MNTEHSSLDQADDRFTRNPHLRIIHCGDDEIVVKHGSRSRFTRVVRDEGRSRLLGRLLRHVCGPTTLAELLQRGVLKEEEREESRRLVDYLRSEGILVDPAEDATRIYLDTILGGGRGVQLDSEIRNPKSEIQNPLAAATVGIAGAGYLGSRIAAELARLGVGGFLLLDDRAIRNPAVDARYFALPPASLEAGRPYTDCLREFLTDGAGWNPRPTVTRQIAAPVTDEESLVQLASGADFIVAAFECFSAKTLHTVNAVAIERERPWISVYVDGSEAIIGPLYIPGETCCYNEFEIQHEATLGAMKDDYLLYKEAMSDQRLDESHLPLPPYLSVAGGYAATAVMRFLLSGRSFLVGRCMRVDFERLTVDCEEVLRLPRCPACAGQRPAHRHLFM